jgi:hypothetical protein
LLLVETYSHTQQARAVMLQREILICEFLGSVDGCAARTIAVDEIASLDHEIFDLQQHVGHVSHVKNFMLIFWVVGRTTRWNLQPL